MKSKIFTIVVGLLALYVILHLIVMRKGNVVRVERQSGVIERKLGQNDKDKKKLMREKVKMEKILASIPTTILEGFADPERQFVDFMDYIENSDLKKMKGSVAISQMQTFKDNPVPLQETQFEFNFNIQSTRRLEQFLEYLLIKGKYPLNVQRLEIKRNPEKLPHVFLKVALLLPAKIDLPQFSKSGEETSS
ncbi:MAG: hypothetical protein JRH15_17640 [Deltaproteobacteria bacterium]|nr:hypothetical protein [Deltaproteobacteria bacterium]